MNETDHDLLLAVLPWVFAAAAFAMGFYEACR